MASAMEANLQQQTLETAEATSFFECSHYNENNNNNNNAKPNELILGKQSKYKYKYKSQLPLSFRLSSTMPSLPQLKQPQGNEKTQFISSNCLLSLSPSNLELLSTTKSTISLANDNAQPLSVGCALSRRRISNRIKMSKELMVKLSLALEEGNNQKNKSQPLPQSQTYTPSTASSSSSSSCSSLKRQKKQQQQLDTRPSGSQFIENKSFIGRRRRGGEGGGGGGDQVKDDDCLKYKNNNSEQTTTFTTNVNESVECCFCHQRIKMIELARHHEQRQQINVDGCKVDLQQNSKLEISNVNSTTTTTNRTTTTMKISAMGSIDLNNNNNNNNNTDCDVENNDSNIIKFQRKQNINSYCRQVTDAHSRSKNLISSNLIKNEQNRTEQNAQNFNEIKLNNNNSNSCRTISNKNRKQLQQQQQQHNAFLICNEGYQYLIRKFKRRRIQQRKQFYLKNRRRRFSWCSTTSLSCDSSTRNCGSGSNSSNFSINNNNNNSSVSCNNNSTNNQDVTNTNSIYKIITKRSNSIANCNFITKKRFFSNFRYNYNDLKSNNNNATTLLGEISHYFKILNCRLLFFLLFKSKFSYCVTHKKHDYNNQKISATLLLILKNLLSKDFIAKKRVSLISNHKNSSSSSSSSSNNNCNQEYTQERILNKYNNNNDGFSQFNQKFCPLLFNSEVKCCYCNSNNNKFLLLRTKQEENYLLLLLLQLLQMSSRKSNSSNSKRKEKKENSISCCCVVAAGRKEKEEEEEEEKGEKQEVKRENYKLITRKINDELNFCEKNELTNHFNSSIKLNSKNEENKSNNNNEEKQKEKDNDDDDDDDDDDNENKNRHLIFNNENNNSKTNNYNNSHKSILKLNNRKSVILFGQVCNNNLDYNKVYNSSELNNNNNNNNTILCLAQQNSIINKKICNEINNNKQNFVPNSTKEIKSKKIINKYDNYVSRENSNLIIKNKKKKIEIERSKNNNNNNNNNKNVINEQIEKKNNNNSSEQINCDNINNIDDRNSIETRFISRKRSLINNVSCSLIWLLAAWLLLIPSIITPQSQLSTNALLLQQSPTLLQTTNINNQQPIDDQSTESSGDEFSRAVLATMSTQSPNLDLLNNNTQYAQQQQQQQQRFKSTTLPMFPTSSNADTHNQIGADNTAFYQDNVVSSSSLSSNIKDQNNNEIDQNQNQNDFLEKILTFLRIFIMSAIIIGDICGNSLVILSVCRHSKLRVTTNWFVVSLACADILVALFAMTFNASVIISGRWLFKPWVCDFWNSCDVLASTASILHLCCISIDRYVAIMRPLDYPMKITTRRVMYTLCGVWISSALLSYLPIFTGVYTTSEHINWLKENPDKCEFVVNRVYAIVSSSISFWIPCCIMVFVYYRIYKEASRQEKFIYKAQSMMPAPMANHHHHNNHHGGGGNHHHHGKSGSGGSGGGAGGGSSSTTTTNKGKQRRSKSVAIGGTSAGGGGIKSLAKHQQEMQNKQQTSSFAINQKKGTFCSATANKINETNAATNLTASSVSIPTVTTTAPNTITDTNASIEQQQQQLTISNSSNDLAEQTNLLQADNSTTTNGNNNQQQVSINEHLTPTHNSNNNNNDNNSNSNKLISINNNNNKAIDEEDENEGEEEEEEEEDSNSGQSTPTKRSISKMKREHKAAKTLGIIMGVFIICWLPFFTWYTPTQICGKSCDGIVPRQVVTILFWIGYFNSTLNPIIYAYFNHEFRDAFKKTLQWIFCCCNDLKCLRVNRPNDNQHYNCTYRSTQEIGLVNS